MPGWCPQRRGTARTLPNFLLLLYALFVLLYAFFVLFYIFFCVLLFDVCFVTFPVLFVCICVLNNCHRVATQLQLNISHHIILVYQINYELYEFWYCLVCNWAIHFRLQRWSLQTRYLNQLNIHGSVHRNNILLYKSQQDAYVSNHMKTKTDQYATHNTLKSVPTLPR
jgi:hypothetical protein